MKTISIVIPCLNESSNLSHLIPEIIKMIPSGYSYEIICVDDGSTDGSRETLLTLCKKDKNVKAIFFHKNFGHQQALRAGIVRARGNAIITMDADFQHPPSLIPKLVSHWEKGADLVRAKKLENERATLLERIGRVIGYKIWDFVSKGVIPPGVSDFRIMDKSIALYLSKTHESEVFLRGLLTLPARKIITIPYKVGKRKFGNSKYTFRMFLNMFLNGFISFSIRPLRIGWVLGILIFFLSGSYLVFDVVRALINNQPIIEGFKTLVVLFIGLNGVILIYLGIMAEYIGVIFKEVKKRPRLLIDRMVNF